MIYNKKCVNTLKNIASVKTAKNISKQENVKDYELNHVEKHICKSKIINNV